MKYILIIFTTIITFSCATKDIIKDDLYYYNKGLSLTKKKLYQDASDSFSEVGRGNLYTKSKIMQAYCFYKSGFYEETLLTLENIKDLGTNISKEDKIYLNYLEGMTYYRQLSGYKSSQENAKFAFNNFKKIIENNDKNNKWKSDSKERLSIIKDRISKHYIYLGKYYMETENFIPAINKFNLAAKNNYSDYYRDEALYRLAEIYYHLGITRQSIKLIEIINKEYKNNNQWKNLSKKLSQKINNK
jgi:outer membrane protein assembly factor BamD